MINKKKIIFFIIFILLHNCSFDSKTGIWNDAEKEKKRIAVLETEQSKILKIEKVYSADNAYSKEIILKKKINLSKPKNYSEWKMSNLNHANFLGNIYLSGIDNKFLKKKIGKDKFSIHNNMSLVLVYDNNIIFSDDKGTIFNINKNGKVNWKKNIYKKSYKNIYKNLVFSIYGDSIYVADNIGLIYSIKLNNGKLRWIKNYGASIKSNIKISDNQIFFIDQNNRISSLNVKDGSLIWDILSISSFIKSQNLLSLAVSPDGFLFAITSAADVYKIDIKTGSIIWSRNTADSLYANASDFLKSSELVLSGNQIIFSSGSKIFSYDTKKGKIKWKNDVSYSGAAIIDDENIFVITNNGYFVILKKNTGEIISSTNILKILKKKKQNTQITNFIMGSGKIYSVTSNGFLIVSSAFNGKAEYFKKIGEKNISPLIINDGVLYLLTESSRIIGFK